MLDSKGELSSNKRIQGDALTRAPDAGRSATVSIAWRVR